MTNRRKIEHRLLRKGSNANKITKDKIGSGSIEVKHLSFSDLGTGDYLVDLADTDVLALADASNSNAMKGLKLGDFKNFISASTATGRTGSVQFNAGNAGGEFGGALPITSDGTHLTASNIVNPGVYTFRFTSGSTVNGGGATTATYGPAAQYKAQLLEVKSSGSEEYLFFLSDGTDTTVPTANDLNISTVTANANCKQIRVEAVTGITDWRSVVNNFFTQMSTRIPAGLATITSSSAGSVTATASITVTYAEIGGGIAVGGGKFASFGSATETHRLATAGATRVAQNISSHDSAISNNAGQDKQGDEPANTGVFVETGNSGSEPRGSSIYFVQSALGVSPDDVRIASDTSNQLDLIASHTSSGIVSIKGGTGVHVKTTLNDGFIFTTASTGVASLVHGSDQLGRGVLLQRGNIQFRDALGSGPAVVIRSGSTDVFQTRDLITSGTAGVYTFRFTSGSVFNGGGGTTATYGPAAQYKAQLLEVKSSGSEEYLFFLSDGTDTTVPTANDLNISTVTANANCKQIRVEAVTGITDWRSVVNNFFTQMSTRIPAGLATITSSSAGSVTATASITVTYAEIGGGIAVGGGKFASFGSATETHRLATAGATRVAQNISDHDSAISNNAGQDKQGDEPANTGVFVETATSGTSAAALTHAQLGVSAAKLYFDNGTTYYIGSTSNVQYLSASAAKFDSLEVTEIVSRTTTKNSLEVADNLIIAGVSGSKHGDHVGSGFQLGGKVGVQGTGSAALLSMTLGDPSVGKGSLLLNVSDTRIVSVTSGSFYNAAGAVGNGMLAVTGALSSSLLRSQNVSAGTVTGSTLTIHRLVTNKLAGTGLITQDNIQSASITSGHIGTGQVTHIKLSTGVATADNFQTASVDAGHIVALNATTAKINDGAATKVKFGVGAVTLDKMATGSVSTLQILDANVTKAKIAVGAVTLDKMATGSVSTLQILDANVTKAKIAVGAVTLDKMATGSVSKLQISDANVTKAKIAVGAVTLDKMATGSVGDKALNVAVVQNSADAHGGISWSSGKLSLGFVRRDFGRSGNNFVTDAVSSPFTTASLSAQPASGTVQVYFNGTLLAPEHFAGAGKVAGSTQADYRIVTSSANAFAIHVHPDLALDSDDVLTVTYFSGSGLTS